MSERAGAPNAAQRVADLFRERYGAEPELVWAAPGRVNLIGEHTDYNEGFVLPFALPHSTAVAASRSEGSGWTACSEQMDERVEITELVPGRPEGWGAYVAGVVWTLREAGHRIPGARLAIASDVPLGAGLSSSHSLECAVLCALVDLAGVDIPLADRPRLVQRAENGYVGAPTGIMDQTASLLSRAGHTLFLDCRSMRVEHVPLNLEAYGQAIMVIDTLAPHRLVSGEYAARRATCEKAASTLGVQALRDIDLDGLPAALSRLDGEVSRRRVRHVVTENQRVLDTVAALRAGDVGAVGPLMTASHESMRDDYEITVPEVDTAAQAALDAGAHGARMTGGGFGGCVLALVDTVTAERVDAAVRGAYAARGFTEPACFLATPSPGARRWAPRSAAT